MPLGEDEAPPAFGDLASVAAVRHGDELLGALALQKPPNEPLSVTESRLLEDLAAQAGPVLRNVRLTADLQANVEKLRASRRRLVEALPTRHAHNRTKPLKSAVASVAPSGENATAFVNRVSIAHCRRIVPRAGSRITTTPFAPPSAILAPSGANATCTGPTEIPCADRRVCSVQTPHHGCGDRVVCGLRWTFPSRSIWRTATARIRRARRSAVVQRVDTSPLRTTARSADGT